MHTNKTWMSRFLVSIAAIYFNRETFPAFDHGKAWMSQIHRPATPFVAMEGWGTIKVSHTEAPNRAEPPRLILYSIMSILHPTNTETLLPLQRSRFGELHAPARPLPQPSRLFRVQGGHGGLLYTTPAPDVAAVWVLVLHRGVPGVAGGAKQGRQTTCMQQKGLDAVAVEGFCMRIEGGSRGWSACGPLEVHQHAHLLCGNRTAILLEACT